MTDEVKAPAVPMAPKAIAAKAAEEESSPAKLTADQERELLFRSLLRREERLAREDAAKEEKELARARQRAKNAKNRNERFFLKQQNCKHLKGGRVKSKTGVKDYALFHHMYIDKTQIIGCFICKMRWKPGDTDEFLVRHGRKIRNHTQIGWVKANEMFSQSSNTPSSSEIPQTANMDNIRGGEDIGPAEAQ